jgi:hypothetical protein
MEPVRSISAPITTGEGASPSRCCTNTDTADGNAATTEKNQNMRASERERERERE